MCISGLSSLNTCSAALSHVSVPGLFTLEDLSITQKSAKTPTLTKVNHAHHNNIIMILLHNKAHVVQSSNCSLDCLGRERSSIFLIS